MTLRTLLRADPVQVRVGPCSVHVRAAWADEWLIALDGGRLDNVVPGMLEPSGYTEVARALLTGAATPGDLVAAAKTAVSEAAGRPWWEAVRLAGYTGAHSGQILAALVMEGVDPSRVTLAMWCAAVVAYVEPRLDEMKAIQFQADLRIPPGGSVADLDGFDSVQF